MHIKNITNEIFFLFYVGLNPSLIPLLRKKIYLPVYIQFSWLLKISINTFIDIGASTGNVSKVIHHMFPHAKIYAFEPIENEFRILTSKIISKNFIAKNIALSNFSGETDFYVNDFLPMSSFFPLEAKYNNKSQTKKIKVKTTTLDEYFKDKDVKNEIMLKLDTQGSELLVLEGGKKLLKKVGIVHVETAFIKRYKNQAMFHDLYSFLIKHGFIYMGRIGESIFYPIFDLLVEENSIFIKKELLNKFKNKSNWI